MVKCEYFYIIHELLIAADLSDLSTSPVMLFACICCYPVQLHRFLIGRFQT